MTKKIFFCAFLLFSRNFLLYGQQKIVIKTGKIPASKVSNGHMFLAGNFNNWNPADTAWELRPAEPGLYRLIKVLPKGTYAFKLTRGSWQTVECTATGKPIDNRSISVLHDSTVILNVEGWQDDFAAAKKMHTASQQVHIISDKFNMPQLGRQRRVWIYLPKDYSPSKRKYPVIYMHDGQNLFDPETAFAGNPWYADEVTEREIRAGRVRPLILVGIANSVDRLREYGPRQDREDHSADWSREYGRFVVEEVKPFIDSSYRTLSDPENTGVGGSSMGGLISLQLCKWYPDVFHRCVSMSPSLWWDQERFSRQLHVDPGWMDVCKVWLDMGTREGSSEAGMQTMVRRASRLAQQFAHHGMREGEGFVFLEAKDGMHNEAAWGGRFDRVLQFLFGGFG